MEGVTHRFNLNIVDRNLLIGKIDEGQKKILHFTAEEALLLLDLLKKEEVRLKRLAAPVVVSVKSVQKPVSEDVNPLFQLPKQDPGN